MSNETPATSTEARDEVPMQYGDIEISCELERIEYVFSPDWDAPTAAFIHLRDTFGQGYKFPLKDLPVRFRPGSYRYRLSFREDMGRRPLYSKARAE